MKNITFFGLKFQSSDDLFIPYPEAEVLVELVLKVNPSSVLDIGTGIGNIAISIAKNLPQSKVIGTDIEKKQLKQAIGNAQLNQVENVRFIFSNLLNNIDQPAEVFVSNLPFIPSERAKLITQNEEPITRLDGGLDGFDLYRALFIQMLQKNLYPRYLITEIDYTQKFLAVTETQKYFPRCSVDIISDKKRKIVLLVVQF